MYKYERIQDNSTCSSINASILDPEVDAHKRLEHILRIGHACTQASQRHRSKSCVGYCILESSVCVVRITVCFEKGFPENVIGRAGMAQTPES